MHNFLKIFRRKKSINTPIKALLIISSLFMFAYSMFSPIYAIFVKEIGGGISTASNTYAIFWLTAGILTFAAGKWENKLKETELAIMWSQFVLGAGYILYYFMDTLWMLYAVQLVMGIGTAIFWPAFHSVYTQHVDKGNSAWQWSLYDGLGYIVPAIAAALGGWLVTLYGFGFIFIIMAILSFVCGLFIFLLPRKIL